MQLYTLVLSANTTKYSSLVAYKTGVFQWDITRIMQSGMDDVQQQRLNVIFKS